MDKIIYDYLKYVSFPSALKIEKDTVGMLSKPIAKISAVPNAMVTAEADFKWVDSFNDLQYAPLVAMYWYNTGNELVGTSVLIHPDYKTGIPRTLDWTKITNVVRSTVPADAQHGIIILKWGWAIAEGMLTQNWIDNLKIYQDNMLIYSNDFSNWNPYIGAGVGAGIGASLGYIIKRKKPLIPVLVGAGIGAGLGGAIGLLTK